VGSATVSGNGTYNPSAGYTPTSAGTYWWYASYSGDATNAPSNSACGSTMTKTYLYSESSVAGATDTSPGSSTTTSSFSVLPSTTYLLLVSRHSQGGDGITGISTTGLTPTLTTSSFTSVASQSYSKNNYQWAYYITTSSSASGTGTLTVTFTKPLAGGQVTILNLIQLQGNSTTAPIAVGNVGKSTGGGSSASVSLPSSPLASDAELVFLTSQQDLGPTAPTATPSMTNLFYSHQGPGSASTYGAARAQQTESFNVGGGKHWGIISLEIQHG
jgi:hypothetical protein